MTAEKRKQYIDSVLIKVSRYGNDSIKSKLLFEIAEEYSNLKNDSSSYKASFQAYRTAVALKDSFSIGRSLYYMGDCFMEYQKDSAYYYYKESEKIFRLLKNEDRLAKVHYNKAFLLFYEGNYTESEIEVIKALQNLENSEKKLILYRCYSLQGSNHLALGEYGKALDYFDQASVVLRDMQVEGIDKDIFYNYNIVNIIDMCNVYDKKGAYSKSIMELRKIISSYSLEEYPKLHYAVLGNLGYSLMKNKNYREADYYLTKAIALTRKEKASQAYLYKIIDYGEYKLLTKDSVTSKQLFKEALALATKLKSGKEVLKTLQFLSLVDQPSALKFKTEYIRVNDSLINQQRENREKFTRIEYETDRVNDVNKVLSNKNLLLLLGLTGTIALFLIIQIIKSRISVKKELRYIRQKELADKEILLLTEEFQRELFRSKRQEQSRISVELHDNVVNEIYGIRMILGSLNSKNDETAQKKRLIHIRDLHKLETEIRNLAHKMNFNYPINEGAFSFLIEQLILKNNEIGTCIFAYERTSEVNWDHYSSVIRINIYRVLQELLSNVNKYAKANLCNLSVHDSDELLIISVRDDGVGFDPQSINYGIGLMNIRERCRAINGEVSIVSVIGKGTEITLKISY